MLKKRHARLVGDVRGTTAIEYALIVGGVALAIVGALTAVGQNVSALLNVAANGFH